ncbi:PaaI family thioesterase [Bacillus salipaludis]|uniref:PaaI family thioesterase n=1 Tax=Bacillus salipaludis TaxID=2547811 RepID=UPI003D1F61FD
MKDKLFPLLEACIENGTENDMAAIAHFLEVLQRKIKVGKRSFIDQFFHMDSKIDENSCEITIPLNPVLNNSFDIVHGGITATLLDTAMGTLANYLLPEGYGAVTNQLNIHYIAPGIGESLRCNAKIIHQGNKTLVVTGEVHRDDGKKIAYATGTFFVIKK